MAESIPNNDATVDKELAHRSNMKVNEFDNQRNLGKNNTLEGSEDPQAKPSSLQKGGEHSLWESFNMHSHVNPAEEKDRPSTSKNLPSAQDATLAKYDVQSYFVIEGAYAKKTSSDQQEVNYEVEFYEQIDTTFTKYYIEIHSVAEGVNADDLQDINLDSIIEENISLEELIGIYGSPTSETFELVYTMEAIQHADTAKYDIEKKSGVEEGMTNTHSPDLKEIAWENPSMPEQIDYPGTSMLLCKEELLSTSEATPDTDDIKKDSVLEEAETNKDSADLKEIPKENPSLSEHMDCPGTSMLLCNEELLSSQESIPDAVDSSSDSIVKGAEMKELFMDDFTITKEKDHSHRMLLKLTRRPSDEGERSNNYDDNQDEEHSWKKSIDIGSDYQATVPDGLWKEDNASTSESEDKLLWDPKSIKESECKQFLFRLRNPNVKKAKGKRNASRISVRDDEQALKILLECGYDVEEALRMCRMNAALPPGAMRPWSEEECEKFEVGIRKYGKNFYLIQKHKVKTRPVGELVMFYYIWKKSERYDIFADKAKHDRDFSLKPEVSDYMDRFMDEERDLISRCYRD